MKNNNFTPIYTQSTKGDKELVKNMLEICVKMIESDKSAEYKLAYTESKLHDAIIVLDRTGYAMEVH